MGGHGGPSLEGLGLDSTWQVPAAYDDGPMLFDATLAAGARGGGEQAPGVEVRFDRRTDSWLKLAHRLNARSWSGARGRRRARPAATPLRVLVGEMTADGLLYRGRVGSGIGPRPASMLTKLLAGRDRERSPFDDEVPKVDAQGTHWVEPFLVIDVDSHATAKNQRLRQPSYRGVRSDLSPEDLLT